MGVRVAGYATAGYSALLGAGTSVSAGAMAANDIAYQRRMDEVGRKFGFTPKSRGERVQAEITATQAAFPEGTQFKVKVQRQTMLEFGDKDEETEVPRSVVETRFVKGGMTGRNTRSFLRDSAGELTVSHDVFTINGEGQGAGIGEQVLRTQFDEYEKMGVAKVAVHANIDVGGYAWARFGFTPTQKSWDSMRKSLKATINLSQYEPIDNPETDEERAYNAQVKRARELLENGPVKLSDWHKRRVMKMLNDPDSKAIWKVADARIGGRNIGKELLMNTHWNGAIKLDDAQAMARFNHYTGRSK
jgi:hypothetical protein